MDKIREKFIEIEDKRHAGFVQHFHNMIMTGLQEILIKISWEGGVIIMNEQKVNYQKKLDELIQKCIAEGKIPSVFLHSCCAPCSSYCLEYLSEYFHVTLFYFNPNISPSTEYYKRLEEQKRLVEALNKTVKHKIVFVEGNYEPQRFYDLAKGLEDCKEGGERCFLCYELRLREAAILAEEMGFDYFTTTLSISPLKNAAKLTEIGERIAKEYKVSYLPSDFKKKEGYKRSIQLSKEYGLYRQDYCGCIYSKSLDD